MPVVCWYWDVVPLRIPELFADGMKELPWEERQKKVMAYRFDCDRRLCLGAGLLLAYALRQAGQEDLRLETGEEGKPFLVNHPELSFNLSHSGDLAVCVVSDAPVGVDVEVLREAYPEIEDACFCPEERLWLEQSGDRERAFYRLWTRKESYLKMLGTGLSENLDSISVIGEKPGLCFCETEVKGHRICVCASGELEVCFRKAPKDLIGENAKGIRTL